MGHFPAAQQTSTLKLLVLFLRCQIEERILRVNESKVTDENTFNGDYFEIEGNHGPNKDDKILCWVFFMICDECFNF